MLLSSERRAESRHIVAVQEEVMEVPALEPADHTVEMPEIRCPTDGCGSTGCRHYDDHPGKRGGVYVRYKCGECGTWFTHRPGLLGRHHPDGVIMGAINEVAAGKSCGAAARDADRHADSRPKEIIPNQSTAWRRTGCARRDLFDIEPHSDTRRRQMVHGRAPLHQQGGGACTSTV